MINMQALYLICTVILVTITCGRAHAAPPMELDPARVAAIGDHLYDHPTALGEPIQAREHWRRLKNHAAFVRVIPQAEAMVQTPVPEKTEALYMDYFETGNRTNWQRVDSQWCDRLSTLLLAECLDNQGRFIPSLEEIILLFCDEPTWVMPAHAKQPLTSEERRTDIDLKAADVGHSLALVDYIVGERLQPAVRARLRAEVDRRILTPFRQVSTGERDPWWWTMTTNNWNAVCLAGVTGAAQALIEDRDERALYIAAAETYSQNFLKGFTPDGYCSEGVGYWGYGYGHYLLLCEVVYQATQGEVDLLRRAGAEAPARYAAIVEIQNGIFPPFADCSVNAKPSPDFLYYVNRRLGLGFKEWDVLDTTGVKSHLPLTMMFAFPTAAERTPPEAEAVSRLERRTWFPDAGVLIARPGAGSSRMAVAMKGGHNAEHHNHNDLGSYLVVLGDEAVLVDPGAEVYTQRTFSKHRYESDLLSSYGHPVPKVAGQLQRPGRNARGEVVSTDFGDTSDLLVLDLTSGYDVPALTQLQRSFHYDRSGQGTFTVVDSVVFDTPQHFESALVTLGSWSQVDENTLAFRGLDEELRVHVEVEGSPFEIVSERIDEAARTPTQPTRVGIKLTEPVERAVVTVTITPEDVDRSSTRLINGGFEEDALGWRIADGGISSIVPKPGPSGGAALRIDDTSKTRGSNVLSHRINAVPDTSMTLSGQHYPLEGRGLGVYVQFLSEDGKLINQQNGPMNYAPLGVLSGTPEAWNPFAFPFNTPAGTYHLRVWIHSMNAAKVLSLVDDLELAVN